MCLLCFVPWSHVNPVLHKLHWLQCSVPRSNNWLWFAKTLLIHPLNLKKTPPFNPQSAINQLEGSDVTHKPQGKCNAFCSYVLKTQSLNIQIKGLMEATTDSFLTFLQIFFQWKTGSVVRDESPSGLLLMCHQDSSTTAQRHPHGSPVRCLIPHRIHHPFPWQRPILINFRGCFEHN